MTVFAKVAGAWSFSSAARDLGISQAREQPRTNAGEGFFIQCSRILEEMDAARNSTQPEAPVRGNTRTLRRVLGSTQLGPLVVDFLHQHPEVSTRQTGPSVGPMARPS